MSWVSICVDYFCVYILTVSIDAYVKDAKEERKEVDVDEGKETDILVDPRSEDSSHSHLNVGSESLIDLGNCF